MVSRVEFKIKRLRVRMRRKWDKGEVKDRKWKRETVEIGNKKRNSEADKGQGEYYTRRG